MTLLKVSVAVPTSAGPLGAGIGLAFSKWMPPEPLRVERAGMAIEIRIRPESASVGSRQPTEAELLAAEYFLAFRFFVEIACNVPTELATEIVKAAGVQAAMDPRKQQEYFDLAVRLRREILTTVNRAIAYARSYGKQFWLAEFVIDRPTTLFGSGDARASIDGRPAFPFRPTEQVAVPITVLTGGPFLQEHVWKQMIRFISSAQRPPLAWSLLAEAGEQLRSEKRRVALTEAVSALEVALAGFARGSRAEDMFEATLRGRVDVKSLPKLIQRAGLTGTLAYVLPVLLPESSLPQSVLEVCREAVAVRQTVVHQGQRELAQADVTRWLMAIISMCQILDAVAADESLQG